MIYTFLVTTGYVESSSNACLIFNYHTSIENPKKATERFIEDILFGLCGGSKEKVRELLFTLMYSDCNGAIGNIDIDFNDTGNINFWGEITQGPLVELEGFDLLFSEDEYDHKNFSMTIRECAVSTGEEKTGYPEPIFNIDEMIKDRKLPKPNPQFQSCPHCHGSGQICCD